MLKVHRGDAPPDARAPALKPKLRSWTGRVWRWHPQGYQLMLKLDASLSLPDIEDGELREALSPFASELSSFALYHGNERTRTEMLRIDPDEHPVSLQLFGPEPEAMRSAAATVAAAGADLIDLNMG